MGAAEMADLKSGSKSVNLEQFWPSEPQNFEKNLKFVKQIETSTTLASDAPVPRLLTTH